jgi:hypothetical protein
VPRWLNEASLNLDVSAVSGTGLILAMGSEAGAQA